MQEHFSHFLLEPIGKRAGGKAFFLSLSQVPGDSVYESLFLLLNVTKNLIYHLRA